MQLKPVKIDLLDKFEWANWIKNKLFKKVDNTDHQLYTEGQDLVEDNLNLMRILQNIDKIKAALSVIVG